MSLKLSPEIWVAKYVKSATNGRVISIKLRRILTLVIIPIWLVGFCFMVDYCYDAVIAISKYKKANESVQFHQNERKINYGFPANQSYLIPQYESIENAIADREASKTKIYGFVSILYYVLVFYMIPWGILRIIFWIKDADKTNIESMV